MNTISSCKVSKSDYKKQQELLESYIGKQIVYRGNVYNLLQFLDVTISTDDFPCKHRIECILVDKNGIFYNIFIGDIFENCFPEYCKNWSKLPPFSRM